MQNARFKNSLKVYFVSILDIMPVQKSLIIGPYYVCRFHCHK